MTVEEAEKLVCPFIAERGEDASGFTIFSKHINCITTKCMAWEATKTKYTDDDYGVATGSSMKIGNCEGYCVRLS